MDAPITSRRNRGESRVAPTPKSNLGSTPQTALLAGIEAQLIGSLPDRVDSPPASDTVVRFFAYSGLILNLGATLSTILLLIAVASLPTTARQIYVSCPHSYPRKVFHGHASHISELNNRLLEGQGETYILRAFGIARGWSFMLRHCISCFLGGCLCTFVHISLNLWLSESRLVASILMPANLSSPYPNAPHPTMPVTFPVADCPAEAWTPVFWERRSDPSNDRDIVLSNLPSAHLPDKLLASSIDGMKEVITKKNGFVLGVVQAYNKHHNLVISINAHAEELRNKFVDHTGKKDLIVVSDAPSMDKVDFGQLAVQFTGEIHKNIKDPSLIPWVLPNFSTTTANDTVICSALVMSSLKEYFRYVMMLGCGIPFITLEGTRNDWESLLSRIDKIPSFGEEPTDWAPMLRAILTRFVRAFDKGGPANDKEFWERMVHETPGGSSVPYISGWITAFCAWDIKGNYFGSRKSQQAGFGFNHAPEWVLNLKFDDVWFPRVHVAPEGYAEVDVLLQNIWEGGKTYDCTMLAGHVAIEMAESSDEEKKKNTVKIAPQWFFYVKGQERSADGGFW
ncbi:hypothetical protein H0H93_011237 [Arthromyces matolae]|nr:hypothetical protein H0H93_011237 [Arthromyces matolae]